MKFTFLKKAAVVAATAATALSFSVVDADAKKVRWKMHSAFGKNVAVIGPVGHRIADMVRAMSDGDFDIKVFEPGALAGGYAYYDPVSQGAFEAGYGTPGANQGKNSMFAFASTWPFGPGALEFNAWLVNGGGVEIIEAAYAKDNIKYFYCGMI
ncbi:MAG: C4-dicarboxylate ABC transporter, partial [Pseudomonadota bacterium]